MLCSIAAKKYYSEPRGTLRNERWQDEVYPKKGDFSIHSDLGNTESSPKSS